MLKWLALVWKFLASDEFSRVQAKLLSLAASAGFEHGLSMHRTKEEFAATDYAFLNKISEHAAEPLSIILQLEPEKLARPANVPTSRDTLVSPPLVKESTVTHLSESLELPSDVGAFYVVYDVTELTMTRSERVSSGPSDVVVALSAREKGDSFVPSSVVDEELVATPSVV
ncbi:hypothetical protein Tco_0070103 [Tanacetum coccineum]